MPQFAESFLQDTCIARRQTPHPSRNISPCRLRGVAAAAAAAARAAARHYPEPDKLCEQQLIGERQIVYESHLAIAQAPGTPCCARLRVPASQSPRPLPVLLPQLDLPPVVGWAGAEKEDAEHER